MGFFSELKSDLSQAVNTLMPDDKSRTDDLDERVAAAESKEPVDIDSMLNRLDDIGLNDSESEPASEEKADSEKPSWMAESAIQNNEEASAPKTQENDADKESLGATFEPEPFTASAPSEADLESMIEEETMEELTVQEPRNAIEALNSSHIENYVQDTNAETEMMNMRNGGLEYMDFEHQTPTDELASITEGMIVKGDLATTGSLDVIGKITGNIKCLGKLSVTSGEVVGDSDAAEIYAEAARITGEVKSKGSVKIGQSTVIVGNIFGSSAVIAGAVKGDIDVHGPVVLDTTAIVMGNIKSQSVQINNGAVIEGMCSQSYADVNPSEFFEGLKNR